MSAKQIYLMEIDAERRLAMSAVANAPGGFTVEVRLTKRTEPQSRRFHAMAGDLAKSGLKWNGKTRTQPEWKVLLISGHAVATGQGAEVVAGLEGELVNIRESSAAMGVKRSASLIEYTRAFGDMNAIEWSDPTEAGTEPVAEGLCQMNKERA